MAQFISVAWSFTWTLLLGHQWSYSEDTMQPYRAGFGTSLSSIRRETSVSSGPGSPRGAMRQKCWWLLAHVLKVLKSSGGQEHVFLVAAWFTEDKLTLLFCCADQGTGTSQTGFSRRRCTHDNRGQAERHWALSVWGGGWIGGQQHICQPGVVWWSVWTIIVFFILLIGP